MDEETEAAGRAQWPALRMAAALVGLKLAIHLALIERYGFHGDELYFIECGRHLAWGYVDHPPLVPALAALTDALAGPALWALRVPALVAGAGTMVCVALMVRTWGGGARAQLLAGLPVLFAPAYLRMGSMLDIPVIEVFLCTVASALVAHILARPSTERARLWPVVGLVLGLGLLAKHSVLIYGAGLALALVLTEHRRHLRDPRLWLGGALSLALLAPNLVWQQAHGWPTVEFLRNMSEGLLSEIPAALFFAGQLLYFGLLGAPVWIAALVGATRPEGRPFRPFAVLYLGALAILLLTHGKPYYLAFAYPPLFAAGGVTLERWLARRDTLRRGYVGAHLVLGAALALVTLPVLPVATVDRCVDALFGAIVPAHALTHDLHGEHGWAEHPRTIERVLASLPPDERAEAVVLVGSYSQASALDVLRTSPAPRAHSGHMTHFLWGPPERPGDVLVSYGLPLETLEAGYGRCEEVDRIVAPEARASETDLPVYLCREPRAPLAEQWPRFRRFHNGSARLD